MCIRDSLPGVGRQAEHEDVGAGAEDPVLAAGDDHAAYFGICLLYTSDAADERSSVDLGGRRIIKKKNKKNRRASATQSAN